MSDFTPGPWKATRETGKTTYEVWGAMTYIAGDLSFSNARLIAAAPELLAACEAVLPYFEVFEAAATKPGATWVGHSEITNANLLRAAIVRARGEQP